MSQRQCHCHQATCAYCVKADAAKFRASRRERNRGYDTTTPNAYAVFRSLQPSKFYEEIPAKAAQPKSRAIPHPQRLADVLAKLRDKW
jgi:hypothetical protein